MISTLRRSSSLIAARPATADRQKPRPHGARLLGLLHPNQQTLFQADHLPEKCHNQTFARLFDHLICESKYCLWQIQTHRPCSL